MFLLEEQMSAAKVATYHHNQASIPGGQSEHIFKTCDVDGSGD